ncbi:DUF3857 domain-containing protein [Flavobacterium sp.]|uniref:DUF3857 domain-containing protein n=1 Tax=Flavobacterium sp. TaxID=239 RepID=UPI0039E5B0E6
MNLKLLVAFFLMGHGLFAQKGQLTALLFPDSLKQNANAVVRLSENLITIESQRSMRISEKRIVTVFNEKGMEAVQAHSYYNKSTSIRNISATIYDAIGNELKKIRQKDFIDVSPNGGGTFYSDFRVVYLNYTPVQYPFTVVFECESQTSNTAFIPSWTPIDCFHASVEKSIFTIRFPENVGMRKKESNFSTYNIAKTHDSATEISYTATHIAAQKHEDYSLSPHVIFPKVLFGLNHFHLEGVDGTATSWKDFGLWYADKILTGTAELPAETKQKMKTLVGNETDPLKKAQIVYDYVQQKSRYVGIQVGIGGWKPMPASDVDRLGYGDCKALTNYTRALLQAVDVPSYYTIVYGDTDKKNIEADFVSMQGNHAMLAVPNGKEYVWLECTSQVIPFGCQAKFTDDRDVLVVKPEGGEIVRTKVYNAKINSQISEGSYAVSQTGKLFGKVSIASEGAQYVDKYGLENDLPTEMESHYKDYWHYIANLKISKPAFKNDKQNVRFTEQIEMEAENYGNLSNNRMMFPINVFNQYGYSIKKMRNRKTGFEISRGSYDEDVISVELPQGFSIEALPQAVALTGKFGEYKTEIIQKDPTHLTYKRTLFVKEGQYPKTEYEDFRSFMEQVSRQDNAKIVLLKNP